MLEADAQTDIDNAISMRYASQPGYKRQIYFEFLLANCKPYSLDAFALNIGDPTAEFVAPALSILFGYAKSRGFKLFLSMDLNAKGGTCKSTGSGCGGVNFIHPSRF